MEDRIRKGNDIGVSWAIFADAENQVPYDLTGRRLTMYLTNRYGTSQISGFKTEGHIVKWTYYGKDQKQLGPYTLTLVENEGKEDMHTVDFCKAFVLVARSCEATKGGENKVELVHLDLSSEMLVGASSIKVDDELSEESENAIQNKAVTIALNDKVSKEAGKGLSSEDFTTTLKEKLDSLSNYDDSAIVEAVNRLRRDLYTLVNGDTTKAIDSYNDVIAFLEGIEDSESLDGIIAAIEKQIAAKQDEIADLEAIRSGAAKGATALQSEQYKGTVTGVKINGTTKNPSSGIVDLGTVITAHQDISGKQDNLVSGTNIKTINGQSILGEGNIEIKTEVDTSSFATREELTSLQDEIIANEEVYAAAANDLLARASDNEERISSEIDARETLQEEFQMLKTSIIENEEVIAATLNDIEGRFGYWSDTYATKDGVQEVTNAMLENEEVIAAALANLNEQIANLRTQVESLISAE